MSSLLSKVITDLAPVKAFYLPKCGGLSSKWLPPLWAGLIIHQLLIPLACHCITWLFLGKWASVAPVKWNPLLQSDHSSKLQFDWERQWLIQSFWWQWYSKVFLLRMFLTVFGNVKGWNYFQKSCYRHNGNNYPWHNNFFLCWCLPHYVFNAHIHRMFMHHSESFMMNVWF